MKTVVISYSLTGNNDKLAGSLAKEISAEHIRLTEPKRRNMGTIILDILFNRTPRVDPVADKIGDNDLVLFVGPVWMGQVATPLRSYLKYLKDRSCKYTFISISGGAIGPNPGLANELTKRTGKEPAALINLLIADLLPPDPKPTMKVTSAYRLNDRDVKSLTDIAVKTLRETVY